MSSCHEDTALDEPSEYDAIGGLGIFLFLLLLISSMAGLVLTFQSGIKLQRLFFSVSSAFTVFELPR